MLGAQNRGISLEKRGCPLGMARGTLLPILQSPAIADARLFKRRSYVREAIAALGNRGLGDTYVDFVFGKISGKSCRAGLDTVVGLDLRKGYVGASWASRRHEPSPRRRGPGPSGRDAAEGGDGGLPPPSRTESAARVGAPQPPLPSRGAEIRGKCGADVRNVRRKSALKQERKADLSWRTHPCNSSMKYLPVKTNFRADRTFPYSPRLNQSIALGDNVTSILGSAVNEPSHRSLSTIKKKRK